MRSPETHTLSTPNASSGARLPAWQLRTSADATSVLLELARALRGVASYPDSPQRVRSLAERAFLALSANLARSGPIDLTRRGEMLALPELGDRLDTRSGLSILHASLARHGIERLRIDASLTVDALTGLLELLARPARGGADPAGLFELLQTRDARGLRLNDLEPRTGPPRALTATPPRPSVSLTTPRLAQREPVTDDEITQPLVATPPRDLRGERLRARLVELEHSFDDESHARLAGEIAAWSDELWQAGLREDAYQALVALADHAVGMGGRSERQARVAAEHFAAVATAERLEDLIDRALASDASGIRAAQLLLQRREAAAAPLFERICASPDPLAASPLHALVVTTGDAALPLLEHEIAGRDELRARVALRLAGELQNPALLPALTAVARRPPLARQIEAVRALCLLPGDAAHRALAEALSSQLDQIAIAATEAIAAKTGIDAVPALLDVLESHVRGSRTQLCRALIEVLGRLRDERAVPRLAAILERRPVLRRAHWHAIQLAAVDTLSLLTSREARRALERAASFAAPPIRDRARARLSELAKQGLAQAERP